MRRFSLAVAGSLLALALVATPATADHDGNPDASGMTQLFAKPNKTQAINSDLAFAGDRVYAGNYHGFRIFDVSDPAAPAELVDFKCNGPQNDPVVWENKLLFLAVDRPQTRTDCTSEDAEDPAAPGNFEGVRIFDVSDPTAPRLIKGVFTTCGAHTITLFPKNKNQLMIYVSSYPLRIGPGCGPGESDKPLLEQISVIKVDVKHPEKAKVVAEPKISYPGDPDNQFDPQEHSFPEGFHNLTACHDIAVFKDLKLAAGACVEQAHLWRIKGDGIPDTEHPLWVYDDTTDTDGPGSPGNTGDVAVDFWHSATFSWDGRVVNFIDESFGSGCPPVTEINGQPSDTGRMFFLDTKTGEKLSHFMIPRAEERAGEDHSYCSAHVGNVVPTNDPRYLLVNAWYDGGADVIDFTDPTDPQEIAFYDADSDNWAAYWYEGPSLPEPSLTIYGSDGVERPETGKGFQVFDAAVATDEIEFPSLNPQTQIAPLGPEVKRKKDKKERGAGAPQASSSHGSLGPHAAEHVAP